MASAHFTVLDDRGVLAVAGPDRRDFLQGLVSNDITKVGPARAVYAALLTAQGRYLHDFIIAHHAVDDEIWLETEAARLTELKRRLSVYRLRAKVEITERPDLAVAAAFGGGALAALDLAHVPGTTHAIDGGVALTDPRLAALGGRIVANRASLPRIGVGFAAADPAAYDRHRLALGIPDGSRDLVPDKSILLEAGFDELNGVDWQKGCYVGQELTARTKYRGLIRKRLFPVRIDGPAPAPGTAIAADGRADLGEMRSSRDGLGLALLRLEALAEPRPLSAARAIVTPFRPDWMRIVGE